MLDELAHSISLERVRDLEARVRSRNESTVPAVWEIAVGFALSRAGKIIDPGDYRPGNPDYIFIPRGSSKEIVVEVTALSDRNADNENPVDDFVARLGQIAVKEGVTPALGSLNWNLGDVEVNGRIVIGIPERRDIDSFFKTHGFNSFLLNIKASPSVSCSYPFKARGATSVINFIPGQRHTSGGHRSHKVARRLDEPSVYNRLKSKEKQLSKADFDMPAIVFLCDNDSHLLKHSQLNAPGTFKVGDIVSTFLNGRPHLQSGHWVIQQGMSKSGNRIDAVITLTVHQPQEVFSIGTQRELRGRVIQASHCDEYLRSSEFLHAMQFAVSQLPVPVTTPNNAMRAYRWPAGYGGGKMTTNEVTISLLTLQKLLAGEISHDDFSRDHDMLATQLERLNGQGQMISSIDIEHREHTDDDWVTLKFGTFQPDRLFSKQSPVVK